MTELDYVDRLGAFLDRSTPTHPRRGPQYLALTSFVAVVALGVLVLSVRTSGQEGVRTSDDQTASVVTTIQVAEPAGESAPPVTELATGSAPEEFEAAPQVCVPEALADRILLGQSVLFDYDTSDSPASLASMSVVIRGQLISIGASSGAPMLLVKVREAVGTPSDRIESSLVLPFPFPTGSDSGSLLVGDFVAFVELVGDSWFVHPDGLWVGCGNNTDAVSVFEVSPSPSWQRIADGGVSLDELWEAALFGDEGLRSQVLNPPLLSGDGAAVFDLTLTTGSRFRLSLPEELAAGLDVLIEPAGSGPVVLEGPAASVSIGFEFCRDEDAMVPNRLGSSVSSGPDTVRFCRPDELLSTTVHADVNFEVDLDLFDLRPIAIGSKYGSGLRRFWTDLDSCSNCARWGPMIYRDEGVVINRTGKTRVSAVSLDDLAEVWTVDTGGFETSLVGGPDAVFLDVTGGSFQRRNAATGALEWAIERDDDEGSVVLTPLGGTSWLLTSSFRSEGSSRAPLLRAIDIDSGQVRWTAEGREWAKWQATAPALFGELVVLMDVTDFPQGEVDPLGGSLRAYDIDSGRLVWVIDLQSPTEGYRSRLMFVLEFEDGKALIVKTIDGDVLRIDPTNGEVVWRTAVGNAQIAGTVFDSNGRLSVSLSVAGATTALDPRTGELVEPAA